MFPLACECRAYRSWRLRQKSLPCRRSLLFFAISLPEKEDAYRAFATDECGLGQEHIDAIIEKAHSAPQNVKRLQDIHEAYQAMVTKCKEVQEVEARFNAARGGSAKPALVKQGNIVWIQLLKKTADLQKIVQSDNFLCRSAVFFSVDFRDGRVGDE